MHFKPRTATALLGLCMLFTGASGLVGEYILSTVSTYLLGNSIEQFSITIALMLGMMGVGGWVQKFITNNFLIEKLILVEIILALLIAYAPLAIYGAFGFFPNHFTLILYFFIVSIGFLIGFEIPLIIRINEQFSRDLKTNLSTVISADYFGSLIGALFWVYYLLPFFAITESSFIISGLNFIIAFLATFYFGYFKKIKYTIFSYALLIITAILLIFGYSQNRNWNNLMQQKFYEDKIVKSETTKYQHLVMTHNKTLDEYRLYINGNVQFSSLDEKRYHELLIHPAMALNHDIKNVLVLGGGDGLGLRELNKYKNIEHITMVELDPKMVEFSRNNKVMKRLNNNAYENAKVKIYKAKGIDIGGKEFVTQKIMDTFNNTQRLHTQINVIHIDADIFLNDLRPNSYDLVIIDFPDPSSIELTKLYSKEFYLKIRKVLKAEGSISIQATSPYHAKEAYLCIERTLQAAGFNTLAYHHNIPSFGDWGWFIASEAQIDKEAVINKLSKQENFEVSTSYLSPKLFLSSLEFGKDAFLTTHTEINTLMKPSLLYIYTHNAWLHY